MFRASIVLRALGLVAASLALSACGLIEPGTWAVTGTSSEGGTFVGQLEIRDRPDGTREAIRVIAFDAFTHDGRAVETAWTGGRVRPSTHHTALITFALTRADFISRVGALQRTDADAAPLIVTAIVDEGPGRALTVRYEANEDPGFGIDETGTFSGDPGAEPIFTANRWVQHTHSDPGPFLKPQLFDLFATYHALPEVQPYVDNPRFQGAIHTQTYERTDFEYYRAHPDRIRVVNKVVDAIGLAETEVRANAFRTTFREKADGYQAETSMYNIGPHGMFEMRESDGTPIPDGDGALWTGVYAYTQALRYLATGATDALDDVRRTVAGIMTLIDITGDPTTFARTLRLSGPPLTGNWVAGTGEFAGLDWLRNGNNDMSKGLLLGLVAGWMVLPEGDLVRAELPPHALAMLDLCVFQRVDLAECEGANPLLGLPSSNPGVAEMLAGELNDDPALIDMGVEWMRQELLFLYPTIGGGPFYFFGISDWSGNHLTLAANASLQWAVDHSGDTELAERWRMAAGRAWEELRLLESPLHAAYALSIQGTQPAIVDAATDAALWGLRTFPFPKHPYPVDRTIRADFVLSPYPSLPWKLDWETNPGRQQSLDGFTMLETNVDQYLWNGSPFGLRSGGNGDRRMGGADYLFLYWLARAGGVIGETD
ncbi:MAG: hypothetical protein KC466_06460 [Myxococcales bacterium]|nr:hypothetical protein [Myxococcales bacterium]